MELNSICDEIHQAVESTQNGQWRQAIGTLSTSLRRVRAGLVRLQALPDGNEETQAASFTLVEGNELVKSTAVQLTHASATADLPASVHGCIWDAEPGVHPMVTPREEHLAHRILSSVIIHNLAVLYHLRAIATMRAALPTTTQSSNSNSNKRAQHRAPTNSPPPPYLACMQRAKQLYTGAMQSQLVLQQSGTTVGDNAISRPELDKYTLLRLWAAQNNLTHVHMCLDNALSAYDCCFAVVTQIHYTLSFLHDEQANRHAAGRTVSSSTIQGRHKGDEKGVLQPILIRLSFTHEQHEAISFFLSNAYNVLGLSFTENLTTPAA